MGYDGVEIRIGPNHLESMPDKINATRHKELRQLPKQQHLSVPAFIFLGHILKTDKNMYQNNLALTGEITQPARDFDVGETLVIAKGIGGKKNELEGMLRDLKFRQFNNTSKTKVVISIIW